MSTVLDPPEIRIPDTVREFLDLTGDAPHELLAVVTTRRKRELGRDTTLFVGQATPGSKTEHLFSVKIMRTGWTHSYELYLDGEWVGTGHYSKKYFLWRGKNIRFKTVIYWGQAPEQPTTGGESATDRHT